MKILMTSFPFFFFSRLFVQNVSDLARDILLYISESIRKKLPARFSPRSGRKAKPATLNPGEFPSRRHWENCSVTDLSAGGLLGASCQKQGGGEPVFCTGTSIS